MNQTERSLGGMAEMSNANHLWYPYPSESDTAKQFALECYASQIFQAEVYKAQISHYRRGSGLPQHNLGALYWQLNEIWSAPTWASIEVDGRWKMVANTARDIYKPVIIAPYQDPASTEVDVWVTSDLWDSGKGTAKLAWYDLTGKSLVKHSQNKKATFIIGAVNSTSVFKLNITTLSFSLENAIAVLDVDVTAKGKHYSHSNVYAPTPFSSPNVTQHLVDPKLKVTHSGSSIFVVESHAVAGWVWLEHPLGVTGYFSENGFWMLPGKKEVKFIVQDDSSRGKWTNGVTVTSLWDLVPQ